MISLVILLLNSCLSLGLGTQADANVEYHEYHYGGVEKIVVHNTAGRIAIAPMPIDKIEITESKRKFGEHCILNIRHDDAAVITIEVEQTVGEPCVVDFDLRVPRNIDLEIASGSGNVTVDGVGGRMKFDLGSGNLTASGNFKKIDGKTGSGNVDVRGIDGEANVSIGSGQLKLAFNADAKGNIDVKSGSGDATLLFPKGMKVGSALKTGTGEIENDFSSAPSRPDINLSASSGSGNLTVKSY